MLTKETVSKIVRHCEHSEAITPERPARVSFWGDCFALLAMTDDFA